MSADPQGTTQTTFTLDRWQRWATGAGLAIAAQLGADPDRVCVLLDKQVRRQVGRLQDELAG